MEIGSWFVRGFGFAALAVWTGCQPPSSTTARDAEQAPPSYEISCPDEEDCPESVALLVGLSAPYEPTRCTAALIGPRTAVTAGHCVAWELLHGGSCEGVWLGFASHGPAEPEWLSCKKIRSASRNDDSLSSPDFAILELRDETTRAPLELGRDALDAGEVVWMVSVTADRFYDNEHLVRSRRCVVDANPDMTPWAPIPSSEVRVLSSCPIHLGNSGAPLLDRRGRMRGLVHAGGPPFFAFGLMTGSERLPETGRGARLD